MALRVCKDREVLYPVTAKMLSDKGDGSVVDVKFTVTYIPLSRKEYRDKMRELNGVGVDQEELSMREAIRQMYDEEKLSEYDAWLRKHVVGWGNDVIDEDGEPIPFSDENYAMLMDIIPVGNAIDTGLWACTREEPAKN